jgi:CheY-like chemotaxis protein
MTTSKTILVVEDDPGLRQVVKRTLEDAGYTVMAAEDSVFANAQTRLKGGIVDLLLADINLPGLTGGEYASYLKNINPNLKVLYMSGYFPDEVVRVHLRNKTATFLPKPFSNQQLLDAVKAALGQAPEPGSEED